MMKTNQEKISVSYRDLFQVALPLIITSASFTLLHFCDRMFLSWYSPVSIQAVVPAGILSFTLISFFMALCSIANSFVAQYYGAGDRENCSRSVAQSIFMACMSAPLIWLLIPVGIWMISASGHAPEVFEEEKVYLSILMIGGFNAPLTAATGSFYSGRGKTRIIMLVHLIGNSVNVVLNWFLIFGHGPFPELGIRGAALASLIAGFVAPSILLALYFSNKNNTSYFSRRTLRLDRKLFQRMLRFGLPSGVHMVLDVGSFSLFVLLLGRLGEVSFLASNIVLSVNMIAFMPSIGIGQAASVLVGQCMGRRDPAEAESAAWKAWKVGAVYTLITVTTFVLFPEFYIRMFARGEAVFGEVFSTARLLLLFAAAWGVMEATNAVLSGALRGAGDTHFVMWFHTTVAWGFFALGEATIVLVLKGSVYACWGWAIAYFALLALGWIWRMKTDRWKRIELIERTSSEVEQSGGVPV
ncbi:MATE family efflux transporter [Tichowtungia aerotolerans]|uniref:Multidrug-efflux transporter n=1 Tax=Tichowtungia aerotolerans TaxID=2697043 RepID=A0A6P1M960_9BACT|nr:MATE family efflux transporter [Tichowtungia aerotolerans]QHI70427.1 MATE family efflux transporter [Tichowtungia aerotolerans]